MGVSGRGLALLSFLVLPVFGCSLEKTRAHTGIKEEAKKRVSFVVENPTGRKYIKFPIMEVAPAWDLDSDGLPDFAILGKTSKGRGLFFISGRTGDLMEWDKGNLAGKSILWFPRWRRPSHDSPRKVLVLTKEKHGKDSILSLAVLGPRGVFARPLTILKPFGSLNHDYWIQSFYGEKGDPGFPEGLVLTSLNREGGKFITDLEIDGNKERRFVVKPLDCEENVFLMAWEQVFDFGPIGPRGERGFGVFLCGDGERYTDFFRVYLGFTGRFIAEKRVDIPSPDDTYDAKACAVLGDIDHDAWKDFLLGDELLADPHDEKARGGVKVFSGKNGKTIYALYGDHECDEFGCTIAVLPDLDGDGCGEFAVGAGQYASGFSERTRGYVRFFSGRNGRKLGEYQGKEKDEHLGWILVSNGKTLFVSCGDPEHYFRSFRLLRIELKK